MAGPFLYTPPAFQPAPFFIPSPYYPHTPLVPTSPYLAPAADPVDTLSSPSGFPRPRKVSWHAGMPPSPFSPPYSSRRRSFGGVWDDGDHYSPRAPTLTVHPFLSGQSPTSLYFDLSSPVFSPMQNGGSGYFAGGSEELHQPATNPPVTRMWITHKALKWPIEIKPRHGEYAALPPITVGEVLYNIHQSLRRQISHRDWAELGSRHRTEIARAYTRRYTSAPSTSREEAAQGIRRVDYLETQHIFVGLAKSCDRDEVSCWELLTRSA